MRFAKVRADRVQPGCEVPAFNEYPVRLRTVASNEPSKVEPNSRIIAYQDGARLYAPDAFEVEVRDESGLIQLREDVEVYGPYVTTSTMDPATSGAIHFHNVRISGPVVADLLIRQDDKTVLRLNSVEVGHLESMARYVAETARADATTPRYHAKHKGGCGEYHVEGEACG